MQQQTTERLEGDATPNAIVSVLFVCTGNICRSPTAESVFRQMVEERGLGGRIHIESAGTHSYHVGNGPDPRAREAARRRGFDLDACVARQITVEDCRRFDIILAMDADHYRILSSLCSRGTDQVRMFLEFAPDSAVQRGSQDVPDPYYGGDSGFERVLDLVEGASRGLLESLLESNPELQLAAAS